MIKNVNFTSVLDLAAGHGRNSRKLSQYAKKIIISDINRECIDFCKERFKDDPKFEYVLSDGYSLKKIKNNSITLVYCFDAMVHFDSDVIREYLKEFERILQPGCHGFCHHSNYTGVPGGDYRHGPHWRSFMSKELFAHYCKKSNLRIIKQNIISWGGNETFIPQLDCLTLFQKPL
jgi:ubiquinone/menaquinone biosynthesis C-methylase UbiE